MKKRDATDTPPDRSIRRKKYSSIYFTPVAPIMDRVFFGGKHPASREAQRVMEAYQLVVDVKSLAEDYRSHDQIPLTAVDELAERREISGDIIRDLILLDKGMVSKRNNPAAEEAREKMNHYRLLIEVKSLLDDFGSYVAIHPDAVKDLAEQSETSG